MIYRDWSLRSHGYGVLGTWFHDANYPSLANAEGNFNTAFIDAPGGTLLFDALLDGTGWVWTGGGSPPGDLDVVTGGNVGQAVAHPVRLYELSLFIWYDYLEFAAPRTVTVYLNPDSTPDNYSQDELPGSRGEVALFTFDIDNDFPPRYHEIVFPASALEILNSLVTSKLDWNGRIGFVIDDPGPIGGQPSLWGATSPYLRAGFQQAKRPTIRRGVSMSQIQIINRGLQLIGQKPIASLSEEGEPATAASLHYDGALDAILAEYPWNFATTRKEIAKSSTDPVWGFANAYPLPPDALVVWEVEGDDELDWDIEVIDGVGKCLVSDIGSPVSIRYTFRQVDEATYSPLFSAALSARIAMELAEVLTQDQSRIENAVKIYNSRLQRARQVDSQEQTPEKVKADLWSRARGQGRLVLAKLDGPSGPLGY